MAESDRTLSIEISLEIHQSGINPRWSHEREVPVPPAYTEEDLAPFIRHELERSVTALEEEKFGEARAAKIIAAYELRARMVRRLLRRAARDRETQELVARVRDLLELDNDDLFARYGDLGLED